MEIKCSDDIGGTRVCCDQSPAGGAMSRYATERYINLHL